ncbi:UDP-2,4-diacetamido-2,4,6-trideoxy-beta-L-altropyranose hydrolase [Sphingopyxis sp.]|uniref:UDP-2,4-diacetamido-2,4, 6-trideoxy-beta-L-altropyranose hydrolase n=1 Tax=Sphingopyxis sp. TaxID=1908224 RepID=UPI002EDB833D
MNILIRADASLEMGIGHVMRCLTLADGLRSAGGQIDFVCREHPGHFAEIIRSRGYAVHLLPMGRSEAGALAHSAWLGGNQADDAAAVADLARAKRPDWLIVDHYGLDITWERTLRPFAEKIMVVDDLADRNHDCDVLLDQNLGRSPQSYEHRVPEDTVILAGSAYALLRPEFARYRAEARARRRESSPATLLIALGGVDQGNLTGRTLAALARGGLPDDMEIVVVLGPTAPWREAVANQAAAMPMPTRVIEHSQDMARLMSEADAAIGAAGSTAWERCCLGLPTMMWILADNQRVVADALVAAGAAATIEMASNDRTIETELTAFLRDGARLAEMSRCAAALVDGRGVERVMNAMGVVDGIAA